tara:strand:- start:30085 stop:30744 length:660 start_codon:yes stop_codon:yes gene_type:complete
MKKNFLLVFFILLLSCSSNYQSSIDSTIKIETKRDLLTDENFILSSLDNLLFDMNKDRHQQSVLDQTWINKLTATRKMSNEVHIGIVEYQPLAITPDGSYLTQSGHLISPKAFSKSINVMMIDAPERRILETFYISRQIQQNLNLYGGVLRKISLINDSFYLVSDLDGREIVFSKKNFRVQLKRLEDLILFELNSGNINDIKKLDFRYKNAVAVKKYRS